MNDIHGLVVFVVFANEVDMILNSHCLCRNDGTIGNGPGKFCFAEDRLVIFNLSVIEFDNTVSDGVIPVVMADHEHGLTSGFQLRQKF